MREGAQAKPIVQWPQPGDLVVGKYRVRHVLGQGGMGRVLSATNEATGKHVALKWILDPASRDASARFAREARAAGCIHHPNVVDVYDVIEHEGAPCLVMELLRGESLAAVLAREGRLPIADAVSIAIEMARGVEAAHREGVIHRDLKPANLFVCERVAGTARVKILDFGISKISDPEDLAPVTHTGAVMGTPHYMAPEQVRGVALDHRADIYAMGAVLYEMLAGRPPHDQKHVPALLVEIATVAPLPVDLVRTEIPSELADIVGRAIAKEPRARFRSAESLAEALESFAAGAHATSGERRVPSALTADTIGAFAPTGEATPSAIAREQTRAHRPRVVALVSVTVIGLAVIALAIGGAFGARSSAREEAVAEQSAPVSPLAETSSTQPLPGAVVDAPSPAATVEAPTAPPADRIDPPPSGSATAGARSHALGRRGSSRRQASSSPVLTPPPPPPPPVAESPSTRAPRAGRIGLDDF